MTEILTGYFQEQLTEAVEQLSLSVPDDAQIYVANLLSRFARSEHLFTTMEGRNELEPLAFILSRALEEEGAERIKILRHLGDTALYTSGFFADRIERRGVEVDYYIEMGGRAYSNVSSLARGWSGSSFQELYARLADCFADIVRVLWELAERTQMVTPAGLLELYRKWERTGSARIQKKLLEEGFLLGAGGKPIEC